MIAEHDSGGWRETTPVPYPECGALWALDLGWHLKITHGYNPPVSLLQCIYDLRLWFRIQKPLFHRSSGKQYVQGPSLKLGNKCPGQRLPPPLCEAKSSPSEELASGSLGARGVPRLQLSIAFDLTSSFFTCLSCCLCVSGMELAKGRKPSS